MEAVAKAQVDSNTMKDLGTSVLFNCKQIEPGEIVGLSVFIKGHRFRILDETDDNYIVVPLTLGMQWSASDLIHFFKGKENKHYTVVRHIKVLDSFLRIDANVHGVSGFLKTPEQRELIDNTDMGQTPKGLDPDGASSGINRHRSHWRMMANGKLAYVKGADSVKGWGDNHREALAYNLARIMGLGKYLATTSLFKHPSTKRIMAVVEAVPFGRHYGQEPPESWKAKGFKDPGNDDKVLKELGDSGELDKLALFDQIIGNVDRHHYNWMITHASDTKIRLIDHGLAFDASYSVSEPNYWYTYHSAYNKKDRNGYPVNYSGMKLHPAAREWLDGLDVSAIRAEMESVNAPSGVIDETIKRIEQMKAKSKEKGNNLTKGDAFRYDR